MLLEIHTGADVTVVRCSGRMVKGDGAEDLLPAVMSQESRQVQMDLSGVSAVDACGLGVLARLAEWARTGNRSLQMINPSSSVRTVLEATRLSSVLPLRSTTRGRGEAA